MCHAHGLSPPALRSKTPYQSLILPWRTNCPPSSAPLQLTSPMAILDSLTARQLLDAQAHGVSLDKPRQARQELDRNSTGTRQARQAPVGSLLPSAATLHTIRSASSKRGSSAAATVWARLASTSEPVRELVRRGIARQSASEETKDTKDTKKRVKSSQVKTQVKTQVKSCLDLTRNVRPLPPPPPLCQCQ